MDARQPHLGAWARAGVTAVRRAPSRRSRVAIDPRSPGKTFPVAAALLLTFTLILLLDVTRVGPSRPGPSTILLTQLDAGALAVALLLAVLCFVHWRLLGEAALLWLAIGSATYGLFALALGYGDVISVATRDDGILLLYPASRFVVFALVVRALLSADVDTSLQPMHLVLGVAVAISVVTVGLQLIPATASLATTALDAAARDWPVSPSAAIGVAAVWLLLGARSVWLGLRGRPVLAWFGLLFVALGLAEVVTLATVPEASMRTAGPAVLRLMGLLCAVSGVTLGLSQAYVSQGNQLLASVTSERTARARAEARSASHAERVHEARNALAAIEGATRALQRQQADLDPAVRAELTEAVSTEVHRLQELITDDAVAPPPGRFRLTEALAAVVTSARSQGLSVDVDVPDHLVALGQPGDTAQALHNVFQNALRYAGRRVTVEAGIAGEHVELRIGDDGPGIPEEEREAIFSRGFRGSTARGQSGSGLGLHIAAKLLRQQGGDLRIDAATDAGACFVLRLPGFSELAIEHRSDESAPNRADEHRQVVALDARRILVRSRPSGSTPATPQARTSRLAP